VAGIYISSIIRTYNHPTDTAIGILFVPLLLVTFMNLFYLYVPLLACWRWACVVSVAVFVPLQIAMHSEFPASFV
jgi:hypothetical protein